jgi:hypothetical protein
MAARKKAKAGFFAGGGVLLLLGYLGHAAYYGHIAVDALGWHDEIMWAVHKVFGHAPKPAAQNYCNAPGDCPN